MSITEKIEILNSRFFQISFSTFTFQLWNPGSSCVLFTAGSLQRPFETRLARLTMSDDNEEDELGAGFPVFSMPKPKDKPKAKPQPKPPKEKPPPPPPPKPSKEKSPVDQNAKKTDPQHLGTVNPSLPHKHTLSLSLSLCLSQQQKPT